ncbi:hypothetical protein Ate02nite_09800 [Paractinoplanes tereljensis]|uniref:Uncharacterized protein n=1 Tax=Paractinoplanes tereljensis TaxID=571912 RepID=A0A919NGN0_9ACTN|nr:hypothetical protein Ate02nite_09800 [Actinoplanes tereljensis]
MTIVRSVPRPVEIVEQGVSPVIALFSGESAVIYWPSPSQMDIDAGQASVDSDRAERDAVHKIVSNPWLF